MTAVTASDAIGSVATAKGGPTVTRGDKLFILAAGNEIFKGDVLQTARDGALGVTFDDETTLTLGASTQITVNEFIYQVSSTGNTAVYTMARGTLAFFAGQAARSGDMKIATPSASLGIRGTTGVVDVLDRTGRPGETKVKLYQDQGGTVGRIEIFDNTGAQLGLLSRAQTGLAIRLDQALTRSLGQPRFAAVTLSIDPQELVRDRAEVRQLFNVRTLGRQIINIRRGGTVPPAPQLRTPNLQGPPAQRPAPAQRRLQRQQNLQQTPALQRAPAATQPPGQLRRQTPQRPPAQRPRTAPGSGGIQTR
ncbi:MAG TPA: FecR domain-containing protein [Xanthobacteraceae bacterium]|nr:FecR domain-containing protein [Xanthobacteraceae bacterium]